MVANKMVEQSVKIRHFLRCCMHSSNRSLCVEHLWKEASHAAVCTTDYTLSPAIDNINPHEHLYGSVPNYNLFRVFGSACLVYLLLNECMKSKLVLVYVVSMNMALSTKVSMLGSFLQSFSSISSCYLLGLLSC